jgi:Fe2+ transport system protein B
MLVKEAVTASQHGRKNPNGQERTGDDQMRINDDKDRQAFVKSIVNKNFTRKRIASDITLSDKVDRIVANPILGIVIFGLIMWAVYALSINGLGGWASGYINDVLFADIVPNGLNAFFESVGLNPLLQSLIVDGAVGGVGAVLGFIPLIMVLFFCLALLEDSGYMARVAVIMDRYFRKIGLNGKSIIPMIVGTGCSIPGLMEGTARADYARCVDIATAAAIRRMVLPGTMAVVTPIVVGLLDKHALGGMLAGVTVSGVLLAIFMANAGGAWDNAKKHIESGQFGGKGSDAHKAAVVGDTVGDPFKDTAGPSLNILIKLMSVVALVMAPLLA